MTLMVQRDDERQNFVSTVNVSGVQAPRPAGEHLAELGPDKFQLSGLGPIIP